MFSATCAHPRQAALEVQLSQAEVGFGCYHSQLQAAMQGPVDISLLSTSISLSGFDSFLFDTREFSALPPFRCSVSGEQMSC